MTLTAVAPLSSPRARARSLCVGAILSLGFLGCDRTPSTPAPALTVPKAQPSPHPEPRVEPAWTWSDATSPVSLDVPDGWAKVEPSDVNPQAQLALRHPATKQTVALVWAANRYEGSGIAQLTRFKHEALEHMRGHIPAMQLQQTTEQKAGAEPALLVSASARVADEPVSYRMVYTLSPAHQVQLVSLSELTDSEAPARAFDQLRGGMQWKTKP